MDLRAIYLAGMEMADPEQRQAFVEEACGTDEAMRHQVLSMFRALDVRAESACDHTLTAKPAGRELSRLGSFRLLEVLGHGGMGMVYLAEDENLGRKVAVKVLLPMAAVSPSAKLRFLKEAKAAAGLESDYVVPVYQVGEDGGVPYLVMPFLKGESLDRWLDQGKECSLARVLQWGQQVARGLAAAHAKGLVHRDIKPGNIWVEACVGRARILDFGLARAMEDSATLTQEGIVVGTPGYMAPEQAQGEKVDDRTDLFSLGAVLYRLCGGRTPFKGQTPAALLTSLVMLTPTHVGDLRPTLPKKLADLIMQMLEKTPADRPGSAREVLDRLIAIEQELADKASVSVSLGDEEEDGEFDTLPAGRKVTPRAVKALPAKPAAPRRRWVVAAVALAGLTALAAGALAILPAKARPGAVVVRVPEAGVEVLLDGEARALVGPSRTCRLEVAAGSHRLEVRKGDDVLYTGTFDMTGGEAEVAASWTPRRFTNAIGIEFALVKKGTFHIGGRGGLPGNREATIASDFYIGLYEVTQEQWCKVMGADKNPSEFSRYGKYRDAVQDVPESDLRRFPVEAVSLSDCREYIARLNKKLGERGWVYRLPTQTEWEYACRGGHRMRPEEEGFDFNTGEPTNTLLPERANFKDNGLKRSCKVGSYPPNRMGLFDMHGNVFEICGDVEFDENDKPLAVFAGGAWHDPSQYCRVWHRGVGGANDRFTGGGLRLVRVPTP